LRERGHEVFTYTRQNPREGGAALLRLAAQAFWNQRAYIDLSRLIRSTKPDVVHLHNTFPLISPAPCHAARRYGLFFRDGRPCEDGLHKGVPWPAVIHACYRDSCTASLAAGSIAAVHAAVGTWTAQVDRFIALTEFSRQKFIAGGRAADTIVVKPNVVHPDPSAGVGNGRFALFVGRLSREKGIAMEHGRTGLQFTPGDPNDLARQVAWISAHPSQTTGMRKAARAEYEKRYSIGSNYPVLCRIYADAIAARRHDRSGAM
jgi:glycosyltransferase involved in cell wall biosynthesis